MHRVFIGMPAGRAFIDAAAGFRHAHPALKVRWIRPEDMHITMVPPWMCGELDPVCNALQAAAASQAPIQVRLDSVTFGPDARRPRLIWAKGTASEGLAGFSGRLRAAFGDGQEAGRRFLLHLTIARFNRQEASKLSSTRLDEPVAWSGTLDGLCLYESILKPSGAEYRVICRVPLARV